MHTNKATLAAMSVLFILLLAIVGGCKKTGQLSSIDPKSSFVLFKDKFVPAFIAASKTPLSFDPKHNVTYVFSMTGDHIFDLQKTDSLISPFVGVIDLKIRSANWGDGTDITGGYRDVLVTVALQDNAWHVTKVALKYDFTYDISGHKIPLVEPEDIKPNDGLYTFVTLAQDVASKCQN